MQNYKIVFSGPMGAGKSKAIRALSDTAVLSTEQLNTDLERHSKEMTTVGMDYGQLTLNDDLSIGLYGTPGQERFEFMWPILLKGALGVVIVIDHSSDRAAADLVYYLEAVNRLFDGIVVVGIGHVDMNLHIGLSQYRDILAKQNKNIPMFPVDMRVKDDVLLLIETIVAQLECQVESTE